MIFGIGTDIVAIDRFKPWLDKPALMHRFFSAAEIEWCISGKGQAAASLAARFAAKEALGKALGTGLRGILLRDIAVGRDVAGKPLFQLGNSAIDRLNHLVGNSGNDWKIHLSLSHDGGNSMAFVIIEIVAKQISAFAEQKFPIETFAPHGRKE